MTTSMIGVRGFGNKSEEHLNGSAIDGSRDNLNENRGRHSNFLFGRSLFHRSSRKGAWVKYLLDKRRRSIFYIIGFHICISIKLFFLLQLRSSLSRAFGKSKSRTSLDECPNDRSDNKRRSKSASQEQSLRMLSNSGRQPLTQEPYQRGMRGNYEYRGAETDGAKYYHKQHQRSVSASS